MAWMIKENSCYKYGETFNMFIVGFLLLYVEYNVTVCNMNPPSLSKVVNFHYKSELQK